MRLAPSVLLLLPLAGACALAACTLTQDPASTPPADPLGTGVRISDVQNPSSPNHQFAIANPTVGSNVDVSSVMVSWIDTFDETKDGKSRGTVYIQDIGSQAPYSGISVYEPSYVPASLRPLPGDILDFSGPYQEVTQIGTAVFTSPETLPQLAKPVGTFRYECPSCSVFCDSSNNCFQSMDPVTIQLSDIDGTAAAYPTGRKWEGMLVTLKDITVGAGQNVSNRVTYIMGQGDAAIDLSAAAISNELYDLRDSADPLGYPAGTHFSSVTGIVTWFYSYQVAPRSKTDLVQ
jgi:hypothetical protein